MFSPEEGFDWRLTVNDEGVFADTSSSKEVVIFPNVDWDADGIPDDGINDPDSTLN